MSRAPKLKLQELAPDEDLLVQFGRAAKSLLTATTRDQWRTAVDTIRAVHRRAEPRLRQLEGGEEPS